MTAVDPAVLPRFGDTSMWPTVGSLEIMKLCFNDNVEIYLSEYGLEEPD